jgi:hypothetical protein
MPYSKFSLEEDLAATDEIKIYKLEDNEDDCHEDDFDEEKVHLAAIRHRFLMSLVSVFVFCFLLLTHFYLSS